VESVGPKVSGELIQTAIMAVTSPSLGAILIYIWLQFRMAVLGGCGGRARCMT
jgi:preprotein translocase subunit SecF